METSPGSGPSGGRETSWGRFAAGTFLLGLVLAVLVSLPALAARPWSDQRLYLYWPEEMAGGNPLLLARETWDQISGYLDLGTFRPVSRLGIYFEHWLTVRTAIFTGVTPAAVQGVVKVITLAAVLTTLLMTMGQYRRAGRLIADRAPFRLAAVGAMVVAAGSLLLKNPASHPLTLFPLGYLGTTALALAVPLLLGRFLLGEWEGERQERRLRVGTVMGFGLLGAGLAGMFELAYLALPLALVHLIMLGLASGCRAGALPRRLAASGAFHRWLVLSGGFLAVLIPGRILIALRCAGGECYEAVSIAAGGGFFRAFPFRLFAEFLPVSQAVQAPATIRGTADPRFWVLAVLAAAVGAAALVWSVKSFRLSRRASLSGRWVVLAPMAGYFASIVLLAALLSALSELVQARDVLGLLGNWRDTGFAWVGWAGLLGVAAAVVLSATRRWAVAGLVVVILVGAVGAASLGNQRRMETANADREAQLHLELGRLVVDFEESAVGNAERCRVMGELEDLAPDAVEEQKMGLLRRFVDATARNHHGVAFCVPD